MATANDFQLSGKVIGGEIQVHLKKGKGQNNEGSVGPESRILFALELPGPTSKGQIRMSATVSTHLEPDRMAFIKKVVSTTATVIHLDPNGGGGGVKGKHRMETLDKDLKEWIKSAHASSVNLGNLQPLLEEFTFFRNQKQGCSTGLVFRRLIECAMKTPLEKKKRIA